MAWVQEGRDEGRTAQAAAGARWFRRAFTPEAHQRLFCLPYAGGNAGLFRNWNDWLAPDVEVVAVELPGRGVHLRRPALDSMDELVTQLLAVLRPLTDLPFGFFGHSLGALVAFELCRRLQCERGAQPSHLFVSGMAPPHLPQLGPVLHALDDAAFVYALRTLEGTPEEVLASTELLHLLLPVLRADFRLAETYTPQPEPRLAVPITAFGGLDDDGLSPQALDAWRELTTSRCVARLLPGRHFFIHEYEHLMAASILRSLAEDGPRAALAAVRA